MPEDEATNRISPEIERRAERSAKDRIKAARWNLDIAVFSFAVLIIVIILLFQEVGIEIVAPVAALGLGLVWLAGWWQGRQLYQRFYDEELVKLERASKEKVEGIIDETVEEKVQKALRERWR